jgi:hypothetical protein
MKFAVSSYFRSGVCRYGSVVHKISLVATWHVDMQQRNLYIGRESVYSSTKFQTEKKI